MVEMSYALEWWWRRLPCMISRSNRDVACNVLLLRQLGGGAPAQWSLEVDRPCKCGASSIRAHSAMLLVSRALPSPSRLRHRRIRHLHMQIQGPPLMSEIASPSRHISMRIVCRSRLPVVGFLFPGFSEYDRCTESPRESGPRVDCDLAAKTSVEASNSEGH